MKRLTLPLLLILACPVYGDDEVDTECRRIGQKLASVTPEECRDRGLKVSGGKTVSGAPILVKEYPPLDTRHPQGRVLLIGGIHGDEYSSVTIVFKWMRTLDTHHSGLFHWRIVPLLNPDGLLRAESQRMNGNGVDLNRNFPVAASRTAAHEYWIDQANRDPRRYPGERPLSEPETEWLVNQINEFKPDVIVAVHAPHGVVDYDGPHDGPYKLGLLYLNLLGTYPGSLGNYAGVQQRIPVVTVELPYAGVMPKPAEIADIWRDLVQWLGRNIPVRPPMAGQQPQDTEPS